MVARSKGATDYVPARGDLVWLAFDPQAGHEQSGRRPALVVSPAAYNHKVGLAIVCPITSRANDYPFEVALPAGGEISGVILADQVKSLDWRARRAGPAGRVGAEVLQEALGKLWVLVGA